jgi:type I restriction enzyme S subunit
MTQVSLREVCSQSRDQIRAGDHPELKYIGLESIESGTGEFVGGDLSKTPETPRATSFHFDTRHVLYGKLRPYLNKVAVPEFEGKCSTELVPLLPSEGLDRRYLAYFLRSPATVQSVTARTAGSRMPRADIRFLLGLKVSLPSLREQHRIVDLLSRAEGIVRLRREAQRKAAELIPAIFLDLFGDPATNPNRWPLVAFGDLGQLDRGKSRHRPRDAQELYDGPYPFIQTGDVANSGGRIVRYEQTYSELGLAQSRLWPAGTLCITIAANIARTGVLDFDACFPDSVVGFTPSNDMAVDYIQHWLGFLQPTLEMNAPQAAQKNINLNILRNLPVPVPPINLQHQFAAKAEAVRVIVTRQTAALATAQATFDALLHQAFAG